ncbi:alpha-E domain-containing protein [Anthocerotibacter panamensis]|uniref:alpha-E domain-containing protein n=1 Tax=Anthocerotibacter panamensis TaxID=2857077 RepID=UPI001C406ADF|nr:alpha-E domain-containing protein [Anthocerotibacter panamensis]
MLSRIAEYHYWMGRYIERAENNARVVGDFYQTQLDNYTDGNLGWGMVLEITGERANYQKQFSAVHAAEVENYLTFNPTNPNSILSCLTQARENARGIRDQISSELWLALNRLYLEIRETRWEGMGDAQAVNFYERIKEQSQLIDGLAHSTILRGTGWHFIRLGRFLERAIQVSRILGVRYAYLQTTTSPETNLLTSQQAQQWYSLLRSVSCFEVYLKLYRATLVPQHVVELLVLHPDAPRSVRFAVNKVHSTLAALVQQPSPGYRHEAQRLAGRLDATLAFTTSGEIDQQGVVPYLRKVEAALNQIGEHIHHIYFKYPAPQGHLQTQTLSQL